MKKGPDGPILTRQPFPMVANMGWDMHLDILDKEIMD
jgi:hypothetical protein